MEKITYGAPRLVDWVAQIKAGTATVRVHFTGGALTSYGVTPAEYTTGNPFIQKVIEQSSYFKEGRIILLRRTQIPDNTMPVKPAKANAKPKQQTVPKPAPVEPVEESAAPVDAAAEVHDAKKPEQTAEDIEDVAEAVATDSLTIVEASCLQDAQAYLQENYNISSYKIRSYDAAQRAAAEHGIRFVGAKFGTADSSEATGDGTAKEEE